MIQLENAVSRYNKIILSDLKECGVNCWLAGGAIRDYFMGVPIKTDHDIFFPDEENFNKCKEFFKSKGDEVVIKWESKNGMKVVFNNRTFDLIKHFFSNPIETIYAFDFTVSMFAVDNERVYTGETSFIDLAKRQLMINKITFPASTLSRAFRYQKKGFSLCLGEMKKIVKSIQNMPKPENIDEVPEDNSEETSGDAFAGFFIGID